MTGFDNALERARQLLDKAAFLAPLATRIVIGLAFFHTGSGKWHNFAHTVEFFTSLGIPAPAANAAFVSTLELVGGPLLIVGLLTRPVAALLSSTMVVALLTADRANFLASWGSASETSPTDIAAFTFLLFLGWLVFHGPGTLSLDRLLGTLWKRRHAGLSQPAWAGGKGTTP